MDILDTALTPETLYAFMERIPYTTERGTGVSRRLFIPLPLAVDSDIVYCGEITEQGRVDSSSIPWQLIFHFSKGRGLYDLRLLKDGVAVQVQPTMSASDFSHLVQYQFTLNPPSSYCPSEQRKCVWNTTPLLDVLRFLSDAAEAINPRLHSSIQVMRHLKAHDIVHHGALSIDELSTKQKKMLDSYMEFYYTEACGIHDVYAAAKGNLIADRAYMPFDSFQKYAQQIFTRKHQAPRMYLADTPDTIQRIRSTK